MPYRTVPVTGRVPTPMGDVAQQATLYFRLSGFDIAGDAVILPSIDPVVLDVDGNLPEEFELYVNAEGLRGTTYTAEAVWMETTPSGRIRRSQHLPRFQIDGLEESCDLAELLAQDLPEEPAAAYWGAITQAQHAEMVAARASVEQIAAEFGDLDSAMGAINAAVADAESGAAAADASADRAEIAADVAMTSADTYASTALGIAGTTVGDHFNVAGTLSYARYRHDAGGVATLLFRSPTQQAVDVLQEEALSVLRPTPSAENFGGNLFNSPTAMVAALASVSYPNVDDEAVIRISPLTLGEQTVVSTREAAPVQVGDVIRASVLGRLIDAAVQGTNQIAIYLVPMNDSYAAISGLANLFSINTLTAAEARFAIDYTVTDSRVRFVRAAIARNPAYGDVTGRMEFRQLSTQNLTRGAGLPERLTEIEGQLADLADQVEPIDMIARQTLVFLSSDMDDPGEWTTTQTLSPTAGAPVAASVAVASGVLTFTDLSGAGYVIATQRETFVPVAGSTYRLTIRARLVGATVLGVDQMRMQFNLLDSNYGSPTYVLRTLDLTEDWQEFSLDYTAGETPPAFMRASTYKMNTYSDATGEIEIDLFEIYDLTNGARIPQRLAALEAGGGGGGAAAPTTNRGIAPIALAMAQAAVGVRQGTFGRAPIINTMANWFIVQPHERVAHYRQTVAATKWDMSYLTTATEAIFMLLAGQTAVFFAAAGFAGLGGNTMTVTGPAVVRANAQAAGSVFMTVDIATGVVTTTAAPIKAVSILTGGQSNANLWYFYGGPGGFQEAMRNASWMTEGLLDDEFNFIQGATGGTAILKASVADGATNYWYDDDLDAHGPALTTCLDAITAAVAAGQPAPECIYWAQGESDAYPLEISLITKSQMKSAVETVWGIIRAHCISEGATDPQFMVVGIGAHDSIAIRRHGISWARQVYQDAVADTAYAHMVAQAYDVPRGWDDIHYAEVGYHLLGKRFARAYANLFHGADYDLGPTVTGVAVTEDRRNVTVTVASAGSTLAMPPGNAAHGLSIGGASPDYPGGAPCGFAILSSTGARIPIVRAEIGASTIRLVTEVDIPAGATLHHPAGYFPEHRTHDFVRDAQLDTTMRWPGLPLMDHAAVI